MATAITIKPLSNVNVSHPFLQDNGLLRRESVQWLTAIINSLTLITCDTTAGDVTVPLPSVANSPNQEFRLIKISSDAHHFKVTVNDPTTETINKQGAWGATTFDVGTAQGASARLVGDGNSAWYVL